MGTQLTISHTHVKEFAGTDRIIRHHHIICAGDRLIGGIVYYNYSIPGKCYQATYYHEERRHQSVHTDDWQIAKQFALTGRVSCVKCGADLTQPANWVSRWHICDGGPDGDGDAPF